MSNPRFQHDCGNCRFHGTGTYRGRTVDVYTCAHPSSDRTLLLRFGDDGPEYTSGRLFECMGLTEIDKVAIVNGLEFTDVEKDRLFRLLVRLVKDKTFGSSTALADYDLGFDLGPGNAFF